MNVKTCLLFTICMFFISSVFAQNRIITTDGKRFNAKSIIINKKDKGNIVANINGEDQTFQKLEVLVITPEHKKSYTYHIKNGGIVKINKRFIINDCSGIDIPKIFAFKYAKSKESIQQMYASYPDTGLSFDEFESIYNKMQKKIKTGSVIGVVATVISVLVILSF